MRRFLDGGKRAAFALALLALPCGEIGCAGLSKRDALTALQVEQAALRDAHAAVLDAEQRKLDAIAGSAPTREAAQHDADAYEARIAPVRAAIAAAYTQVALTADLAANGGCEPADCVAKASVALARVRDLAAALQVLP